ncbi:MAG TPA: sulfotransferase domain-containing protein [Anaerolineales bacterium]
MKTGQPQVRHTYLNHHLDSTRWECYTPRDNDIIIATSVKSGTTWMQAIVSHLIFQDLQTRSLIELSPWVDTRLWPITKVELAKVLNALEHRRFLKSHLPLDGLPFYPTVKYILVGRDARDVFMSLWNHYRNYTPEFYERANQPLGANEQPFPRCPQDVREFWRQWMTRGWFEWESEGYPFWSNLRHTQTWWDFRHLPNILFVHYNDLLKDLKGEIRRVARYLEIDVSEDLLTGIADALTLRSMKRQAEQLVPDHEVTFSAGAHVFVNKGGTGRWRAVLNEEDLKLYEAAVARELSPDCAGWLEHGGPVNS